MASSSPLLEIALVFVRLDHVANIIANAKEVFSPAKILTVKRDDKGKLSGATIEPVG